MAARPGGRGGFEQGPISPAPPRGLAGCGSFVVVGKMDEFERDLEGRAHSAAEPGVGIRLVAAQTVMDVGGGEPKTESRVSEKMKQCDRVATARERDEQRTADEVREGALEVVDKLAAVHGLHATSVRRSGYALPISTWGRDCGAGILPAVLTWLRAKPDCGSVDFVLTESLLHGH